MGSTVFITKHCLDSSSKQPFKTIPHVHWNIDCARQCKHEPECMFMAFKSLKNVCLLFNSNVNISQSGCTENDLLVYQLMHKELVCEHGFKTPEDKCNCTDSYVGKQCERLMKDCSEGYESGFYEGQYDKFWIKPKLSASPFQVHCYMVFGKTFLQKNSIWQPTESFNRTWQEYTDGFGDLNSNHWLGLQRVFEITNSRNFNLHINIHAKPAYNNKSIIYHNFKISDAASGFQLIIGTSYPMNPWPLGDCLSALNNTRFSTPDRSTCAAASQSGWWFDTNCSECNANGNIAEDRTEKGAFWNAGFKTDTVIYTEMALVAALDQSN